MRADFFRPDTPQEVLARATWSGRRAVIEAEDEMLREALGRIFHPAPVTLVDASTRHPGSRGETVVEPGDLDWFRAAATIRGEREGLAVRFVTETPGGWDPAGAYRSMRAWVADRETDQAKSSPAS
jgi:hypothetical protein